MKVKIVEFESGRTKEGKEYFRMSVQGKFSNYGKLKTKIVDVNLTEDEYKKYSVMSEGKELDLNFVIPLPQFPLSLVSEPESIKPTK